MTPAALNIDHPIKLLTSLILSDDDNFEVCFCFDNCGFLFVRASRSSDVSQSWWSCDSIIPRSIHPGRDNWILSISATFIRLPILDKSLSDATFSGSSSSCLYLFFNTFLSVSSDGIRSCTVTSCSFSCCCDLVVSFSRSCTVTSFSFSSCGCLLVSFSRSFTVAACSFFCCCDLVVSFSRSCTVTSFSFSVSCCCGLLLSCSRSFTVASCSFSSCCGLVVSLSVVLLFVLLFVFFLAGVTRRSGALVCNSLDRFITPFSKAAAILAGVAFNVVYTSKC